MKHLNFSLDDGEPLDPAILIYVIMCLMVTEVQLLFLYWLDDTNWLKVHQR